MKKLLALLIAVLMVVALVPATVLSAMVPEFRSGGGQGGSGPIPSNPSNPAVEDVVLGEDTAPVPDERVEENFTPAFDKELTEGEDKIAILNRDGALVGYFADFASADAWLRDGDTMKLVADVKMDATYHIGTGRTAAQDVDITIDGNGKTVIFTATGAYAFRMGTEAANHMVTFKDLKLVSASGGIEGSAGSGVGNMIVVDNCEIYANDIYYKLNPEFYAANGISYQGTGLQRGVCVWTVNSYIVIKGENTKIYARAGVAVEAAGNVTVYDGELYSTECDSTLYVHGDQNYYTRTEHKLMVYGGTIVNDRLCAMRISGGASAYVFGGTFVMTGEQITDTGAAALRGGTGGTYQEKLNISQIYIFGGDFYTDLPSGTHSAGTTVIEPIRGAVYGCTARGAIHVAGGNFFYNGTKAWDGTVKLDASYTTAVFANTDNATLTVPSVLTGTGTDTVTWDNKTTVTLDTSLYNGALNADGTVADIEKLEATEYEAVVLDKDGKVVILLNIDGDKGVKMHMGNDGVWGTGFNLGVLLRITTPMTPNNGTYMLLKDIDTANKQADIFSRMAAGDFVLDGNGHKIDAGADAAYFNYSNGAANVTIRNAALSNDIGRGLQFGNNLYLNMEWTLENTTVTAAKGSVVYLNHGAVLNVGEGSELIPAKTTAEIWAYTVQLQGGSTLNLVGGTIYGYTTDRIDRAPFFGHKNGTGVRAINLISGKVVNYSSNVISLYHGDNFYRPFSLNISKDAVVESYAGEPMVRPDATDVAELKNPGAEALTYDSLADAVKNAASGAVITLLKDTWETERIVISRDMTVEGNGFVVYDMTYDAAMPLVHIKGDGTDVTLNGVTLVTMNSGIFVSSTQPEGLVNDTFGDWHWDNCFSTEWDDADDDVINVKLNNCKVVAGAPDADAYDGKKDATDLDKQESGTHSLYALAQHGMSTFVTVTGEDSLYGCSSTSTVVANWAGFLDIYDGFFYGYDANQVLMLMGRYTATALTNNQSQSATTAIYGGSFVAGKSANQGLIRTLRGHHLVIVDGEFLSLNSNVIRTSDSNVSGYAYILGGDFYGSDNEYIFGDGNADMGYVQIFGGNFFDNQDPGIENDPHRSYSHYGFNLQHAFGMLVTEGYKINDYDHTAVPVYAADTELEYVKKGYNYLQTVTYDDVWLSENGYLSEGYAYMVTPGEGMAPVRFYGFELERAVLLAGNNNSTITLCQDVTYKQPGKPVANGLDDTYYGIFLRYRPAVAKVTFNSYINDGYYTITASANAQLLNLAGGQYHFDNVGFVNDRGGILHSGNFTYATADKGTFAFDTVITIDGGYYYGGPGKDVVLTTVSTVLNVNSGTFASDGASSIFSLQGDNSVFNFGIKGEAVAPIIIQTVNSAIWGGNGDGVVLNFNNVTFRDEGDKGSNLGVSNTWTNFELNIYDGNFYVNNKSNYPLIQTNSGTTGTVNIYGGTFLRGATGPVASGATEAYGKVLIFEHSGKVNVFDGNFVTAVSGNVIMTVRKGTTDVVIGDAVNGTAPTFVSNGGYAISFDANNPTNATLIVHNASFSGGGAILLGTNGSNGTVNVVTEIHNMTFSGNSYGVNAGNSDVIIRTATMTTTGNLFYVADGGSLMVLDGDYKCTGTNFFVMLSASVHIEAGTWNGTARFAVGATSNKTTYLTIGKADGSVGPYIRGISYFVGADAGQHTMHITVYQVDVVANNHAIVQYNSDKGSITVYGGRIENNKNRLMRIGHNYAGDIKIFGGEFVTGGSSGEAFAFVDNSHPSVVIGRPDGTGPIIRSNISHAIQWSTSATAPIDMVIYGGEFYCNVASKRVVAIDKLPAGSTITIEGGLFESPEDVSQAWLVNFNAKGSEMIINGGRFYMYSNGDSAISAASGTVTINGGYFYGLGMCVARAIGGTASAHGTDLTQGQITAQSYATLVVNGGFFHLDNNWRRNNSATGWENDAVIRAGGGTGYGTVILNGGTYMSDSGVGEYVINKYNAASTIKINGGVYLGGSVQTYYFYSAGELLNKHNNNEMLCEPDPDNIPITSADPTIVYAEKTYRMHAIGDYTSYIRVTETAEIRVTRIELGDENYYESGLRFTSAISADAISTFKGTLPVSAAGAPAISYGTVIVPVDYLEQLVAAGKTLTHADLVEAGLTFLDIAAEEGLEGNEESGVTFTATMTDIKTENYGRRFVAVGYIKAVIPGEGEAEDTVAYAYNEFDEEGISLAALAAALLEAENDLPEGYSTELRELLRSYAAELPEEERGNYPELDFDFDDTVTDPFGSDPEPNPGV